MYALENILKRKITSSITFLTDLFAACLDPDETLSKSVIYKQICWLALTVPSLVLRTMIGVLEVG